MRKKACCPWCSDSFTPHPRLGSRQKCCGQPDCTKKQKNQSHQTWKQKNREDYLQGQKDWRKAHPDYWHTYRLAHPEYTDRNRTQSKVRKALSVAKIGLQKRIDILQVTEKQLVLWSLPRFAKQSRSLTPYLYAKSRIASSGACGPSMFLGESYGRK